MNKIPKVAPKPSRRRNFVTTTIQQHRKGPAFRFSNLPRRHCNNPELTDRTGKYEPDKESTSASDDSCAGTALLHCTLTDNRK